MASLAPRRASERGMAYAFAAVVGAIVLALTATLQGDVPVVRDVALPWPLFLVLLVVAERLVVRVPAHGDVHTYSLTELVTSIGLYLVSPVGLILARILAVAIETAALARRDPHKWVVNIVVGALEAATAAALFRASLVVGGDAAWIPLAALAATVLGGLTGLVGVWLVIRIVAGRSVGDLATGVVTVLPLSAGAAGAGLLVVGLVEARSAFVWTAIVPLAVLLVTWRAYAAQWQRRNALDFLYDAAVVVQATPDSREGLVELTRRTATQVRADAAEMVVVGPDVVGGAGGEHPALWVRVGVDGTTLDAVSSEELPPALRDLLGPDPTGGVGTDAIWVGSGQVATGHRLALRMRARAGPNAPFDRTDLEVLRSVARLASGVLERLRLDELKAAFVDAVSHDLRTPLTVILGVGRTLQDHAAVLPRARQQDLLDRLVSHASRLDRLLGDLLDLERLNHGRLVAQRGDIELLEAARRAVGDLAAPDHHVRVVGHPCHAHVDPGLITRIVQNLVGNAVRYSPEGTSIEVQVAREGDLASIVVEDEGPGIPDHLRGHVVTAFARCDTDDPQPGAGIGLTLVREFARLHGGDVEIGEAPGGGTRVRVSLSVSDGDPATSVDERALEPTRRG